MIMKNKRPLNLEDKNIVIPVIGGHMFEHNPELYDALLYGSDLEDI